MKQLIVSLSLMFSFSAFAISEANYQQEYQEKVVPLLYAMKTDFFKGANNIKIHYATYMTNASSKRCVVILPGRSESLLKYAEVVHSLEEKNPGKFAYFLMDHRGQGSSQRMLTESDDYEKGYVDDFDNYVADLKTFMNTVVASHGCKEKNLVAHSLGAGIATAFMIENPEVFDRAAISSPMYKIQTKPYKYSVARSIVTAMMAIGRGGKFAIGQKPFNPDLAFENNSFTTSPARFEMTMNTFDQFPETKLGGVTNRWLNEVMTATKKIRRQYKKIDIPVHLFTAGIELYSETSEMEKFCNEAPRCLRTHLPDSKHEVLMDRDSNRDVVIAKISELFK